MIVNVSFFYPCISSDKKMVVYQILIRFVIGNLLSEFVILVLLMRFFSGSLGRQISS